MDEYWDYNHMEIQIEDCIDYLTDVSGDIYYHAFLFNHSSEYKKDWIKL